MKPFDNFKSIEKFRKHFKNDSFEMTYDTDVYGTITCNHKRLMSAGFFYKEYVREYGWAFCDKEAGKSSVITPEFLKLCHFYEWHERHEFESYLISHDAEECYEHLKEFIHSRDIKIAIKVLILVHRTELIEQISDELENGHMSTPPADGGIL